MEAFEKWAAPMDYDLRRDEHGYLSPATADAFRGFDARQPEIDALNDEVELKSIALKSQHDAYENEIARLKAEVEKLMADAERWRFYMGMSARFRYFIHSRIWEVLDEDLLIIAEGYAPTYQDAIDAAIAEMKEIK